MPLLQDVWTLSWKAQTQGAAITEKLFHLHAAVHSPGISRGRWLESHLWPLHVVWASSQYGGWVYEQVFCESQVGALSFSDLFSEVTHHFRHVP